MSGATGGPREPGPSLLVATSNLFKFIILVKGDFHALPNYRPFTKFKAEKNEKGRVRKIENSRSREGAGRVGCARTRKRREKAKAAKVSGVEQTMPAVL